LYLQFKLSIRRREVIIIGALLATWLAKLVSEYARRKGKAMSRGDFETILERRPFTPFRLHFTTGTTHDVTHPESVLLADRMAALAVGGSIWTVALAHIVEIEPLPTVAP
jgi:hypothetical protein